MRVGRRVEVAETVHVDHQVRQVAGVSPEWAIQAVLCAQRIVMPTRRGERGTDALGDGMQMDPVEARHESLDVDIDVHTTGCVLGELRRANRRTRAVDDRCRCVAGTAGSDRADGQDQGRDSCEGTDEAAGSAEWMHGGSYNATWYIVVRYIRRP